MRGHFITFEGGEGAGKSTQIKKLAATLKQAGVPVLLTREPGGSPQAEELRNLVVKGEADAWDPVSEALIFMTARYHHIEHVIKPALAKGTWVLCDRFYDSTYVYQGMVKKVDGAWLDMLYRHLYGNFEPDCTLLLDLPAKVGLERTTSRGGDENRFESLGLAFHEHIREAFLSRAKDCPRFAIIDASNNADAVQNVISETVSTRFNLSLEAA